MTTAAWEALHRAQITTMRQLRQLTQFSPLTFQEYDVLHVLTGADDNGLRLNELNQSVALTQSSLSRMLERLEARHYVHRWQDPQDLRGLRVRITDAGAAVHATIHATHQEHITETFAAALTPEELDTLTHLTTKLRGAA